MTSRDGSSRYGVQIASKERINRLCVQTLSPLLDNPPSLRLDGDAPKRGRSEVLLNSASSTTALAQRRYPVIPFLAKGALTYWVALAITMLRERELFVTSASVLVFEGPPRDPDKTPLFRAEWHEWDSMSAHAQPHWHVYPSALGALGSWLPEGFVTQSEQVYDFGVDRLVNDVGAPFGPKTRLEEFHYAMSASWHLPSDVCQLRLSSEASLTGWLHGCVSYSRAQLDYLTR